MSEQLIQTLADVDEEVDRAIAQELQPSAVPTLVDDRLRELRTGIGDERLKARC